MNLIQAIESGRPIRRSGRATWTRNGTAFICDPAEGHWLDPDTYLTSIGVTREDLLSCDWEIKKPSVTFTEEAFWSAVAKCPSIDLVPTDRYGRRGFLAELAKALGFP